MKIMIASDIHGSAFYCAQLLEAMKRENPDKLLLLGDILYHGPRNDLPNEYAPKTVIQMLNEIKEKIICVRGNCDTEVDQMVLEFPILADYSVLYFDSIMVYATHGHHYNESNPPHLQKGDILLNGHTHVSNCTVHPNFVYMNPGSVSIPKMGTKHSYMIYENNTFTWKDLQGEPYNCYKVK